jgi:transposase-like protein
MALLEKRADAEKLYIHKSMACPDIARELGVDEGTVYRWRAEAAERGGKFDWDRKRRLCNTSTQELMGVLSEALTDWILKVDEGSESLSDPRVADALSKNISSLRKIDNRKQYLGAVADLIKVANGWLAENQPELKKKLEPCWDGIYQELVNYSTRKGMF